jgi:hypothetical protein
MALAGKTRNVLQSIAAFAVVPLALFLFFWMPRSIPSLLIGYSMLGLLGLCVIFVTRRTSGK